MYVKNVLDDQANIVSATSGHFSADVSLTANFGGGNVSLTTISSPSRERSPISSCNMARRMTSVKLGLADFSGRRTTTPANPITAPPSTMSSAVWLQVTARLPLVRGMGSFYGTSRLPIMTWTATWLRSVLSRRRGWRVQRQLHGRNRGRWVRCQEVDLVRQIGLSL